MRVLVESIPKQGQVIRLQASLGWAAGAVARALEGEVRAVSGELRLRRLGARVAVEGEVQAAAERPCERCGEAVVLAVPATPDLIYAPEGQAELGAASEEELALEALDVGWYAGVELDLEDVLCEALTLAMPPRVCCEDEPSCEARTAALLAERGTSGTAGHPAFAALVARGRRTE